MAEIGSIYSAVYSGVPVFEMIVNGIAVMRRRTDSYMNATQILKVANIEKGRRTKILEKEVLVGEHEKVQGGYGKYQGTWIPFNKSKELAERYNVFKELTPLFNFSVDNIAVQTGEEPLLTKEQAMVARKKLALETNNRQQQVQPRSNTEIEHTRKKARTYNPAHSTAHSNADYIPILQLPQVSSSKHKADSSLDERYKSVLMSIYLFDNAEQVLELLSTSQGGILNLDMVIDEQGNTALHWATALARKHTLKMLISKGANIACTNYAGETPFMKGVMVTNNFDNNSFVEVVELLKESITMVDNKKRSVLHYATLTAGVHGRVNAAIYYMKILVRYIQESNDNDLKDLLNSQDSLGDTCLNIASRLDCQPIVEILVQVGVAQDKQNNNGLQTNDYNAVGKDESSNSQQAASTSSFQTKKPIAPSQRGKEIVSTVQKIVDALDEEYGAQLTIKDQEIQKVQLELDEVMKELNSTRTSLEEKQAQSQKLSEAQQVTQNIHIALQQGWQNLKDIMSRNGKSIPDLEDISQLNEDEDIDALFNTPDLHISPDASEEEKKKLIDDHVKHIQAKVKAYTANNLVLEREIEELGKRYADKEMQCKKLIAACCNLPIDKIDDLVEPLTLAIESDPPDLDLARVIGFMDKIRRQGAFTEPSASLLHSSQLE